MSQALAGSGLELLAPLCVLGRWSVSVWPPRDRLCRLLTLLRVSRGLLVLHPLGLSALVLSVCLSISRGKAGRQLPLEEVTSACGQVSRTER